MSESLNNGEPLPINAVAILTLENGWEYMPHLVAQRDRYRKALEKIAFNTRDWAPTLESCKSIAVEALKG